MENQNKEEKISYYKNVIGIPVKTEEDKKKLEEMVLCVKRIDEGGDIAHCFGIFLGDIKELLSHVDRDYREVKADELLNNINSVKKTYEEKNTGEVYTTTNKLLYDSVSRRIEDIRVTQTACEFGSKKKCEIC